MKKAILRPFLLPTSLVLIATLACNINRAIPETVQKSSLPSDTKTPVETLLVTTSTNTPDLPLTSTPTNTLTNTPTNTSIPPTFTPSLTATWGVVIIEPLLPIIPLIPTDTPIVHLNYSALPNYGSQNLSKGFSPDPFQMGMTAGGDVDVSYIGGGCSGYATIASDLRLNYTAGGAGLLRFYFIGNQDITLIINTPPGSYFCSDDSFGTLNPTIDFNNPTGGSYDIWVGSLSPGSYVSGILYITEIPNNHP